MTKDQIIAEVENEILELVDNQDDYTRSDLQGRAMAIAMKAYRAGATESAAMFEEASKDKVNIHEPIDITRIPSDMVKIIKDSALEVYKNSEEPRHSQWDLCPECKRPWEYHSTDRVGEKMFVRCPRPITFDGKLIN